MRGPLDIEEAAMKMVLVLALWSLALALSATAQDDTAAIMKQINCGSFTPVSVPIGFQGRFASPNYPGRYGANTNCVWALKTTPDAKFSVLCDPLETSCPHDVFVFSPTGDSRFEDPSRPICGSVPVTFNSTTNLVSLYLSTSFFSKGGRFSCVARAVPAETCDCGVKGQSRIVGGQAAGEMEWPWQVLLADISTKGGGEHYCGATLLHPDWVITAAHCTNGRQASKIGVVLGQYSSSTLSATAQVRRVAQIVQHPGFNRSTINNDIALLKLDAPVTFTDTIRPVCLPTRYVNTDLDGQTAVITGWGTTSYGGQVSDPLLQVSVKVLSTEHCRQFPAIGSKITDNMFCTYEDGKDACQGDSGGPLNWQDPATGRVYMIGITSFGIGCAKPDVPGVYTKVTNYLDWIQQQTGTLCSA